LRPGSCLASRASYFPRGKVAGHAYHVLNCANRDAANFHKKGDYTAFLDLLATAKAKYPGILFSFCSCPITFPPPSLGGGLDGPHCADRTSTTILLPPSSLVLSQGWGLIDLPLRASNEHLPSVRVARAQKIIRLHPLLSFEMTVSLC
jgi:hypothetical protein